MINNYEVRFSLKELVSAFFKKSSGELKELKRKKYLYEVASGRDAIYTILKQIEKNCGVGEIICPNYSCKAIPRAIIKAGFTPVFVDVERTLSINTKLLEKAVSSNTKGLIFYHPWGFLHEEGVIIFARKRGIVLIEDCAQSVGKGVGKLGEYSFFSFRTSKNLGVGSGAIILSDKKIEIPIKRHRMIVSIIDFIDLLIRSKCFNFPKPRALAEKILEMPDNRKMGNFQRNLLLGKIKEIDKINKTRIKNYFTLFKILEKTKNLKNIELTTPISPLYFPLICKQKETAISLFKKKGIQATGYYDHVNSDVFKFKFFGDENSRFFSQNIINLPLHENLEAGDMEKITKSLLEVDEELNDLS